jgi:two-component system sensor histidine kinase UhpB
VTPPAGGVAARLADHYGFGRDPVRSVPRTSLRPAPPNQARFVSLFWRLLVPNVAVLVTAGVVLWRQPANGRIVILAAGVVAMTVVNVVIMRRAFAPLQRLAALMQRVDPLQPGRRLPVDGPESEVTLLTRRFNDMLDRLEDERRESARRELAGQEEERRRIARELHDEIGQNLTALAMLLARIAAEAEPRAAQGIEGAREATLGAVEDVRRLAHSLRPVALDELGLVAALTSLCSGMAHSTGLKIVRHFPADLPAMAPEVETVLYRVTQESLTNVARHASADRVDVRLALTDESVVLTVSDDGRGITDGAAMNGGVRGMRERALLVGSRLQVSSTPGAGSTVELRVPRDPAPA